MACDALVRRRTCLGLALGLAADIAFPRTPDASGVVEEVGPAGTYKTVCAFATRVGYSPIGVMLAGDGLIHGATLGGGEFGYGTVYRVDAGRRIRVLHSFSQKSGDGWMTSAPPTEGDDGALHGVTFRGGAADLGVAYRLDVDGRWEVLHSFGVSGDDGYGCQAGLLRASDGQLYGASGLGGAHGGGVIFRLGKDGIVTPLWQLGRPGEPGDVRDALIEGADGQLYGTSVDGGVDRWGTVFSLARDGSDRRVLHSFEYATESLPGASLVQGTDGFLYGTTQGGGAHGRGCVYRLATDGSEYRVLHDFKGPMDGFRAASPLLELEPGVFVGTTSQDNVQIEGGALFVVTADGRFQGLRRFGRKVLHGVPDGASPRGAMCRLPSGGFVGACGTGGANDVGTLWFARAPDEGWGSVLRT